jgi:hypothetical protein
MRTSPFDEEEYIKEDILGCSPRGVNHDKKLCAMCMNVFIISTIMIEWLDR